ncbi:MAG: chemotaxis protein CheD [Coriobacteriia bacterium]|nr:chemotaxis protein CheD [Coriobacteriia bacterium]
MTPGGLEPYNDARHVIVGVGEAARAEHPQMLVTQALGSCVGLTLWDPMVRIGGMAHIMLPTSQDSNLLGHPSRFASTAVPLLVEMLLEAGCPKRRLIAKLAGGSAMFKGVDGVSIGGRNIAEVRARLESLGIPLRAEDTGGSHARTIELHLDTGILLVRSYTYGLRSI